MTNRETSIASLIDQASPTIRHMAEVEHNGFALVDFTAARTWLDGRMGMNQEASFRRGYCHGYSQAMDDLKAACKPTAWNALARFFNDALTRWRFHHDPHRPEPTTVRGAALAMTSAKESPKCF